MTKRLKVAALIAENNKPKHYATAKAMEDMDIVFKVLGDFQAQANEYERLVNAALVASGNVPELRNVLNYVMQKSGAIRIATQKAMEAMRTLTTVSHELDETLEELRATDKRLAALADVQP